MTKLAAALCQAVQALRGGIVKDGENKHHNYKFATIDDVLAACGGALADAGVAIIPETIAVTVSGATSRVHMRYTIMCGDEARVVDWFGEAMDKADKGIAKAQIYAMKQFLLSLLMVPKTDMKEAESGPSPETMRHHQKKLDETVNEVKQLISDMTGAQSVGELDLCAQRMRDILPSLMPEEVEQLQRAGKAARARLTK